MRGWAFLVGSDGHDQPALRTRPLCAKLRHRQVEMPVAICVRAVVAGGSDLRRNVRCGVFVDHPIGMISKMRCFRNDPACQWTAILRRSRFHGTIRAMPESLPRRAPAVTRIGINPAFPTRSPAITLIPRPARRVSAPEDETDRAGKRTAVLSMVSGVERKGRQPRQTEAVARRGSTGPSQSRSCTAGTGPAQTEPPGKMTRCDECIRLAAAHGRMEAAYIKAMGLVVDACDRQTAVEYQRLRAAWYEARIDSEAARLAYSRHRRIHEKAN